MSLSRERGDSLDHQECETQLPIERHLSSAAGVGFDPAWLGHQLASKGLSVELAGVDELTQQPYCSRRLE